jgi:signal transduction histidine kinase/DNA-binding response OmpR family regulator
MRSLFPIFLTITLVVSVSASPTDYNDLLQAYKTEKNDSAKFSFLLSYLQLASKEIPTISIDRISQFSESVPLPPVHYIRLKQELAIQYNLSGDDQQALEILFGLIDFAESNKLPGQQLKIYTDIGLVYYYKNDCENALKFFKKSYHKKIAINDSTDLAGSFLNIGTCFSKINQFDSAELYIQKARVLYEASNDSVKLANTYNNLGNFYFRQKKDLAQSEYYFKKALAIYSIKQDKRNEGITLGNLGNVTIQQGFSDQGVGYLRQALLIAQAISFPALKRYTLNSLKDFYYENGRFDSAFFYQEKLYQFNDSLNLADQQKVIEELEAKYMFKEQQQALQIKDLKINQLIILLVIFALLIAVLILIALYFHQKKRIKEELEKAKSSFFSNIAHEFKTPLSLVIAPLEDLVEKAETPEEKEKLALASRNAHHVLNLINQLMDVAKLEDKRMPFHAAYGNLVEFLESIIQNMQHFASQKNMKLHFESSEQELYIHFDKDKMQKVFENLLSNAVKYSPVRSKADVFLNTEDDTVRITVKDYGNGIPEDELKNIFDKFYRASNSDKQSAAGTGIGLSLAREFVEMHGGEITVESEVNRGSVFTIWLPLNKEPLTQEQNISLFSDDEPVEILLVEDNAEISSYISSHLLQQGMVCKVATNGLQGMHYAINHVPDVIISDVMMPEMNGIEMTRKLKQHAVTSHIPVIMLSAKSSLDSKLEGLEAEADVYLSKPFVMKELMMHIKNFVSLKEKIRQQFSSQPLEKNQTELKNNLLQHKDPFIQQIIAIVLENIDNEAFSIEDLSSKLALSRTQVHRKVKAVVGLSASVLVRNIRLEKAFEFLKNKQGNVSEIAYKTGFNSASYFSTCFAEYFGTPPTKFL